MFHRIFLDISHIQNGCGKYPGILCKILSIPHNIAMGLNDVIIGIALVRHVYLNASRPWFLRVFE